MSILKTFALFALSLTTPNLYSQVSNCPLEIKKDQIKVSWTAFKTPAKAGVKGALIELEIEGSGKGKDLNELASNTSLKIKTTPSSVSTQDKSRDAKISNFFFGKMNGSKDIVAKIAKISEKTLQLEVAMGGVKKIVPMSYSFDKQTLTAKGVLDVFDFGLNAALASINQACNALHEGKTWSDVEIELVAKVNCQGQK